MNKKTILITGISSGIGEYLALYLSKLNAFNLILTYNIHEKNAKEIFKKVIKQCPSSKLEKLDITNEVEIDEVVCNVKKDFHNIDILINNAGINLTKPALEMQADEFSKVLNINVIGTYLISRKVCELMRFNKNGGKIINISSSLGNSGAVNQLAYSVSKGALNTMTKNLAKEWGKYNVSVNAICPSFIHTNMNSELDMSIAIKRSLLKKDTAKDDLLNFIEFICLNKLTGVSGQVFILDDRF